MSSFERDKESRGKPCSRKGGLGSVIQSSPYNNFNRLHDHIWAEYESFISLDYDIRLLKERPEEVTFTFPIVEHLAEAEVMAADVLYVVFFKSPLNHLRRVVLTGQLGMKQTAGCQQTT